MRKNFLFICVFCFFLISWDWHNLSMELKAPSDLKIQTVWAVDTVRKAGLRRNLVNNSPPLVHEDFVIQGNAVDGIKAYSAKTGKLIWDFNISGGVSSPLALHKENIYFGGADGFFYSLQLKTGLLNWKYFSAVENSGSPLIYENTIYWLSGDQKVYALGLKGSLLWIYSGPASNLGSFLVRGSSRPVIYKNNLYVGFQNGELAVLNRKSGELKWKQSFSQPIIEDLRINKKCLLVPVFNSHLYCLSLLNGKTLWKLKGGTAVQLSGSSYVYQFDKGWLFAFKDRKLKWKKQLEDGLPFPPSIFGSYLVYGFPSNGSVMVRKEGNGNYVGKHRFGKGLAGPILVDGNYIYFLSVSAHLHKLRLKAL